MQVSVFGAGYVGLVTAVGLAEIGHSVMCVDLSDEKVVQLRSLQVPFFEPGLEEMLRRNVIDGRLTFSTDGAQAVDSGEILFLAVGTPSLPDGSADLRGVISVAETIGKNVTATKVVVTKSTVPLGTSYRIKETIERLLRDRGLDDIPIHLVSNPEFLKEGSAVDDFMKPDRIVIGADSEYAKEVMTTLYKPFQHRQPVTITMDIASAELTKYAANAMLASRISFMNEMAQLAELVGADIEDVRLGVGSDPRIGYAFLYSGCGFGGSCFPKDIRALRQQSEVLGASSHMLSAIEEVNNRQKLVLFDKLVSHFQGDLKGKTIAIWGLSFKPDTDDMREAVSIPLVGSLHCRGARLKLFDPQAIVAAKVEFASLDDIHYASDMYSALEGADAVVLVTEWKQFRVPDFTEMAFRMKGNVIVDGRNQWNPAEMERLGFIYYGIGRGAKIAPEIDQCTSFKS